MEMEIPFPIRFDATRLMWQNRRDNDAAPFHPNDPDTGSRLDERAFRNNVQPDTFDLAGSRRTKLGEHYALLADECCIFRDRGKALLPGGGRLQNELAIQESTLRGSDRKSVV